METQIENIWIFALTSKCRAFSTENLFSSLFLLTLAWLSLVLLYWVYPGGPAWGKHSLTRRSTTKPIPGPRGLPLFGSMSLMSKLAHHKLAAVAERCKAKRLMAFSLGETRVIITSNPDVAKEILNSSVFADRPVKESAYSLMFHRAIGFAPYGVYWRTLRRIAATHLFSPKQITSSGPQRLRIAAQMVSMLSTSSSGKIRVRDVLKKASLNNMMCSVFGCEYELGVWNEEMEELSQLVEEGYDLLVKFNWSETRDFVDVLLSLQGADRLTDSDMVAVLWEMIFRGTDTVAVLIEWILARMVLHPDIQSNVHKELDKIVGKSRPVSESDLQSMVYLPAVVKEVLRLHPPGPLLSWARLAITDTIVDGHPVPAGTTAMVNMWAITRDPEIWTDPQVFRPERFIDKDGDVEFSVMGSDLRLAPFGSGRRTCPGKALGLTTVSFWVATLLHEYKWEEADQNSVNLSEVLRLSCEMANPLTITVAPRRK